MGQSKGNICLWGFTLLMILFKGILKMNKWGIKYNILGFLK